MKKYIVTGGEGFIGSKIVAKADGKSFDLKSGQDILDKELFKTESAGFDGIFHCAAKISVPESVQQPDEYYRNNVQGMQCVVDIAESSNQKIVFSSSAAVYGNSDTAVLEDVDLRPMSPYAQNKVDGEMMLKKLKTPSVALRYFNVYGPGQSDAYAGVITAFIKKAIKNEDIVIYGDGQQVRDFIFVDDVVEANVAAMNYNAEKPEVFNIGNGMETSINKLAEKIIALTNSSSKIKYAAAREGDIIYSLADVSKAKNVLGWTAKVSLDEGLLKVIDFYKKNI